MSRTAKLLPGCSDFFAPRIAAIMERSGVSAAEAEEIAQDVMVAVWRKAALYDSGRAGVSTWIFTIARNLRIDRARKASRASASIAALGESPAQMEASAEETMLAGERDARVRQAMATLSPEQATALRLSFFSEKPHAEIARELSLPLGTVKSRTRLAMGEDPRHPGAGAVIAHHPSDYTLARLATGMIGAGPRLVLAVHLSGCSQCRARLRTFEAVGGIDLESATPVRQSPDGLARTLARLESAEPPAAQAPPVLNPELPPPLSAYEIGPWRFVNPGFKWRRLRLPESREANVIMLKVAAGHRVPRHGHSGTEYTQVLTGSFRDALGQYRAGDCIEIDEEVDHQPVVDRGGECICLTAVEGRLRLSGWIGRLLQPLLGI